MRASDTEEAVHRLQEAGLYISTVVPAGEARLLKDPSSISIPENERFFLLHSLAMYLEAGLPIQSALTRLRFKVQTPKLARTIDRIQRDLDGGTTFSEALLASALFPGHWVSVLCAGERRGRLTEAMEILYHHLVDQSHAKQHLLSFLLVPLLLLALVSLWYALVVIKMIPAFTAFFAGLGVSAAIPALFRPPPALLWVGLCLLFFVGGSALLCRTNFCIDPVSLPVIGPLISQRRFVALVTGLQLQVKTGVSLCDALETLGKSTFPSRWCKQILLASSLLREGSPVSQALEEIQGIPAMGRQLLAVAEAGNNLPKMLEILSRRAEGDLMEYSKRLSLVIEKFVFLSVGVLTGILLVALFGTIYSALGNLSQAPFSSAASSAANL